MNNLLNSAVCLLTAASMAVYPYHALGAAPADAQDLEEMEQRIDDLRRKSEQLRGALKRERFDPEARVDAADFDLDTLVAFVRDDIVFQPYAGTMRGAAGTLRAGAGSSLDQSLLLAQMLRSAGFDAQIVRADLDEALARRLLDTTGNAPEPPSMDHVGEALEQVFGTQDEGQASAPAIEESAYFQDTQRHTQALLAALGNAGLELAPADVTGRLLDTVRPYFWVQVREAPSQPWQQAHPAFGGAEAPAALEPEEVFTDAIPEQFQHRFEMRAWIEQWIGGKVEQHAIMDPWVAPVANLDGMAIRYSNVPDGVNKDHGDDFEQVFVLTETLSPAMGEASPPGAMAFDLLGRVIDPLALGGSPAAGIVKTVGDKFADATTDLADRQDGKPAMALHSMYLEFTFHRPGGESETRRRYVLPPRDQYDEDDKDVLRQLATEYTYMVSTGDQSREFVLDRFIEGSVSDLDWLKYVVLSKEAPATTPALPKKPPAALPTLMQQWNMERLPAEGGVVRFRAEPVLVGIRDGMRDARTLFSEVDVVWNPVESLRRDGDRWVSAPEAALAAGVWDTVLESQPNGDGVDRRSIVTSAPIIFDMAQAEGIDLQVLRPGDAGRSALTALSLDAQARQFVERDLDAGYAVVIPERTPRDALMAGWWRVRPDNGETLGMLGDGYGATATEYIILVVLAVLSFIAIKKKLTYEECEGETTMKAKLCCAHKQFKEGVQEQADGDDGVEEASDQQTNLLCD